MLKSFNTHCPTKDKTVTLTVDYIRTQCLEDIGKIPHIKSRIKSCTGCIDAGCNTCKPYSKLPAQI